MPAKLPIQVGITGGIGSGKSVVARIFGIQGIPVYESDIAAKELYFDPAVKSAVETLLGTSVYISPTQLDRKAIASKIYGNASLRLQLNEIIHPAVGRHYAHWLEQHAGSAYILKVAALLFEADIYKTLDVNLLVTCPIELKRERIRARDPQRTESEIDGIMESQWSDTKKETLADGIIRNDEHNSLISQVMAWDSRLKASNLAI